MFRAILYTQWKWARLVLLPVAVLSFLLPVLSVQDLGAVQDGLSPAQFLEGHVQMGMLYPMLGALIALLLATSAWAADHAGRHVYALTLPIERGRLVLFRLGAGLALLAIPCVALWVGGLVAALSAPLPPGLTAYPHLLALRFLLASLVAFALFFAVAAGTARSAGWVLALLAAGALTQLLLSSAGSKVDLLTPVLDRVFTWPGPLDVFTGRWVLIDV
jgi:hypothetical protein